MNKLELQAKLAVLEDKKWDYKAVVDKVNTKTREIKYDDVPMGIYIEVESLAEQNGVSEDDIEYKVREVREKFNDLESALYDLVEPFEDKVREIENEISEIECDISDMEWEERKSA
jgi:hypothetical protein